MSFMWRDIIEDHYQIADNLQEDECVIRVGGEESDSSDEEGCGREVDHTQVEALGSSIFMQVCSSLHS